MARRRIELGNKCTKGHTIEGSNVRILGPGTYACRECHNAYQRERYKRVKREILGGDAGAVASLEKEIERLTTMRDRLLQAQREKAEAAEAERTRQVRALIDSIHIPGVG